MNQLASIVLVLSITGLTSCTYKEYKNQDGSDAYSVQPTFTSLQAKVFTPKCASCHSGPNAPHGVLCSSYEHMMSNAIFPPLIVPGNPEASSLYKVLRDGSMPKDSKPLPKHVVDAVYSWIKNGSKQFEDQPGLSPSPTPGEPGCEPGEPGCVNLEPCDGQAFPSEPGIKLCD